MEGEGYSVGVLHVRFPAGMEILYGDDLQVKQCSDCVISTGHMWGGGGEEEREEGEAILW